MLSYAERNPPYVPIGTNFSSNVSHGNSAPRAVIVPPSAISAAIPATGATSTSTTPSGTPQRVAYQASAILSSNALSRHIPVPNSTPATVQSTLTAHCPIAGRVPQNSNNTPTAVGPSGTINPHSLNAGPNPLSGSKTNTPYSFSLPTNGVANGTSSFQSMNPSDSMYSFPSSPSNAWPATSDQAFPHQLTGPNFMPSLLGRGHERRTSDSLENSDSTQNSSSPPMKRTKAMVDMDSSYTVSPNHGPTYTSYAQRHYSSSSDQHHTPSLGAIPNNGPTSEQRNMPSSFGQSSVPSSLNHDHIVHAPFPHGTSLAPHAGAAAQPKNPSTSGRSSVPSSLNHGYTPFSGITPAPHEVASEQHKQRPSSSGQSSVLSSSSHVSQSGSGGVTKRSRGQNG
ncbi:hypothetical protein GG344DRAFT_82967 [Lentinula edodes]|nr:hypothetical protein GG344DRAFT_82967 [Lentinula edodes]